MISCGGLKNDRLIRPLSSPTPLRSRTDPRCTKCSATSRTAASRSFLSLKAREEIMTYMATMSNIARSKGDPKVLSSGPGSLDATDRLARALGWFSIGLGLAELLAPRALTRALGMEGSEALVRAYGMREIGAGIMTLSPDKGLGLQSRVAGDALDIATLLAGLRGDNPKRDNVAIALAM